MCYSEFTLKIKLFRSKRFKDGRCASKIKNIKVATTLCSFKRQLKSFYFKRLYNVFDGDNVRSFKIICRNCRRVNILKAYSC